MSIIPRFCSEIGGLVSHLQCPHCGHFSKSHAHQLSHIAACHPTTLDAMPFGRLGNVMLYQSTARLFHCAECFFTFKEFGKLFTHLITKHCMDKRERSGGDDNVSDKGEGKTGEGEVVKIKEEEEEKMEEEEEEKMGEEGEELMLEEAEEKFGEEGVERAGQEGEGKTKIGEEGEEKEKVMLERKGNSEGEEEEAQQQAKDGATQLLEYVKDESMLAFEGGLYHCLICGCKNKLKTGGINHVVHKHNVPRAYVLQVMRMDAAAGRAARQLQSSGEEEEAIQLSGEMLKEEMLATARLIRNTAHRFMCQICGFKSKLKGNERWRKKTNGTPNQSIISSISSLFICGKITLLVFSETAQSTTSLTMQSSVIAKILKSKFWTNQTPLRRRMRGL